ncbi:arylsulfatase [Pelagicoccus mobilis]|uniref:Arylsulfatase n=1 Tax=Pelagicoccus mobilis TaxID=415221 RepID=A0A934RXV0_9BACT|nr:arylsulfatase [Pelagicoccus mobilis]MBK1875874.1 arylsulfatase [Pelagicoccus mobilis]
MNLYPFKRFGFSGWLILPCLLIGALVNSLSAALVDDDAKASRKLRENQPNIILIMADDLGYGDVGFNGQAHIKTPNLDRLAKEGMVFSDHYAGSTVCMPSRCSLMTGKHIGVATVRGNPRWTATGEAIDLTDSDVTVAEELKRAGYRTGVVGKWGLAEGSEEGLPTRQGFDFFYGYRTHKEAHHYYWPEPWRGEQTEPLEGNDVQTKSGKYLQDLFTKEALGFVREAENDQSPFFLYLAYTAPHYELTVPDDSKAPYLGLGWPERPMPQGKHYVHDLEGNVTYAGMVSRMDRDIGALLDCLEEMGLDEDTIVLFTSDNGPEYEKRDRFFNSNGRYRGGKRDLYEGGIRVPMVARWPGVVKAGTATPLVSAFEDFLPTVCELAGVVPSDPAVTGISLAPTLTGNVERQRNREFRYWEFNEKQGPLQALRMGDWKAVRFVGKRTELYNLKEDPEEESDVAKANPEILDRMEQIIDSARTKHDGFPLVKRSRPM